MPPVGIEVRPLVEIKLKIFYGIMSTTNASPLVCVCLFVHVHASFFQVQVLVIVSRITGSVVCSKLSLSTVKALFYIHHSFYSYSKLQLSLAIM
jgi:hypothetical protein